MRCSPQTTATGYIAFERIEFEFIMAKLSSEDKMRIQTLREQGLGAKAIKAVYPLKSWKLATLKTICRRFDARGSAVERKAGSGRPKSARTVDNIAKVEDLICSQESEPGTSKSTRQVASKVGISEASVRRIAKKISACSHSNAC